MKNQSNIKVRIPKALFELYRRESNSQSGKEVLREMLKNQLKGMLTEADTKMPAFKGDTADEKNLEKTINNNSSVKQALSRIETPNELDDTFEVLLDKLGLKNVNKSTVIAAFKKALEDIAPEGNTVSTVGDALNEGSNKVARKKKK
jgi:hypothetical protein